MNFKVSFVIEIMTYKSSCFLPPGASFEKEFKHVEIMCLFIVCLVFSLATNLDKSHIHLDLISLAINFSGFERH